MNNQHCASKNNYLSHVNHLHSQKFISDRQTIKIETKHLGAKFIQVSKMRVEYIAKQL